MNNGVPLTAGRLSYLYATADFHDLVYITGRFYKDGGEEELEPGYVMGWEVNNIELRGYLESILEYINVVRNAYNEVVSGRNGDNQMERRCC